MLDTLVVSEDARLIATFRAACAKLGMTAGDCRREEVTALLGNRKFYSIIVDDASHTESAALLSRLRRARDTRGLVSIGIGPDAADALEAMFLLRRPIADELALRTIRAARGMMLKEYRRYYRFPLNVPLTINTDAGQELQARLVNLSQNGLAVQFAESQRVAPNVSLWAQFNLPAGPGVHFKGDVIWCSAAGRAGLRGDALTQHDRRQLEEWLASRVTLPT